MKRIMIDIESLSLDPRALILSIGAVDFSSGKIDDEFYETLNAYEQTNRHVSASTALWWIRQAVTNPEAAAALFGGGHIGMTMALVALRKFCERQDGDDRLEIWFNGPQFDAVALESAYVDEDIKLPWAYSEVRDCRTIFKIAEEKGWDATVVDYTKFTAHNALADAQIQAIRLISAMKYLGIN